MFSLITAKLTGKQRLHPNTASLVQVDNYCVPSRSSASLCSRELITLVDSLTLKEGDKGAEQVERSQ